MPILNVFPLKERPANRPVRVSDDPLRLSWFSQMIGADRGLEDAVRALKCLPPGSAELYLRGACDASGHAFLDNLITSSGVDERAVIVQAPISPDELVAQTARYDVGLALEMPSTENRRICMRDLCTNKSFTYLLGGLALAATGEGETHEIYEGAGFAYPHGKPDLLAAGLCRWLTDPEALRKAQATAWRLGETQYNWDLEKEKLIQAIKLVLD